MSEGVAFVTGASRGIGKHVAERFADEGVAVALAARSDTTELADAIPTDALAVDHRHVTSQDSNVDAGMTWY